MYRFEQENIKLINLSDIEYNTLVQKINKKYKDVYVIISPPRCSSTVFARVFWEHPSIGFYCHEPFDLIYHKGLGLNDVLKAIEHSLSLDNFKTNQIKNNNLVIKEMTFQAGHNFQLLTTFTKNPLMFVIRDPRLAISSRMKKLIEGGQNPIFPLVESGWSSLDYQIQQCQQLNIPYIILDAKDFRNYPEIIFKKIFERFGLVFSKKILSWKSIEDIDLGNLGDEQKHWYKRILLSTGIEAAIEPVPEISYFPEKNGFRAHIISCFKVYENLQNDVNIVRP